MKHPREGLLAHSLVAALGAGYIAILVNYFFFTVWRIQTGADARICPIGAQEITDLCTIGEYAGAFALTFLWSLYGLPFAFLLTAPCALLLAQLSPILEERYEGNKLAKAQYGLAMIVGALAGLIIGEIVGGLAAAVVGVRIFRRLRYGNS